MDKKIGVFICDGCDIAKSLDTAKLVELANNDPEVAHCQTYPACCSPESLATIRSQVNDNELNRVVIAACSERVFTDEFNFGNEIPVDRTNLRERVAWCHEPNDEDTQMLAEDYIRMGLAKVKNMAPPEPFMEDTSKEIMVVGGGVSGMTAAKAAADAGYQVTLVEKEPQLGGWARKWPKVFPKNPPYVDLEDSGYQDLIREVEKHPKITIHCSTTVKRTKGQPGMFEVDLQNGNGGAHLKIGSIIQATGWRPYDAKKLTHLGYGASPDVITNVQMEEMAAAGAIKRPSDGQTPKRVAFIQCAGSRDQDHLPYCSAVCCRVSLKQAKYVREQLPDTDVYILYKDIRSPQQFENFYAAAQDDEKIFLTKGEVDSVTSNGNGPIAVELSETLFGKNIRVEADLLVLATGMVPSTKVDEVPAPPPLAEGEGVESAESTTELPVIQDEGVMEDGKRAAAGAEKGAKILNLSYRQGTDLPTLKYGFPDSHFICFPYETRRTGIYATGATRAPMDLASSANDASGAAMKAIQAVESIARGEAVHPRAGDMTYPEFFMQRCTQCKRCTEECPFGTLDEDEKGTPLPNPLRCRRCGICMGSCPERIISFKNYNVGMMSAIIKAIDVPDEFEEKPRVLVFACENDAGPTIDMVGLKRLKYNSMVRIVPLRCLGSMNVIWINDALASGFDGVILLGCKKGDDYQCHFVKGSELASYRMDNVREKLTQLVLEEDRVELHEISMMEYERIPAIMDEFLETVERVGYNPYKDM
ncbi:MAG: FAD-dependent oxidoreductase [candidate division Zixibacteria bacterium]|nr:FAD-dependent oxidoreductase [candidate division Zixibacteria bacterium]